MGKFMRTATLLKPTIILPLSGTYELHMYFEATASISGILQLQQYR